jgi:hypothetical protein
MSLLALCQSIQDNAWSAAVRESTWGFLILGALHVLALAWSGGAILLTEMRLASQLDLAAPLRIWKRLGVAALLVTGALLFWVEPVKCYQSVSFRVKMALLLLIAGSAFGRGKLRIVSLLFWIAVIFAARGIAFF